MPVLGGSTATRVVFVITWMDVGGAERFALDAISQLRRRGCEVALVTTAPSTHRWRSQFEEQVVDVLELDTLSVVARPAALVRFLRGFTPDVILVSNSWYLYDLMPFVRRKMTGVAIVDYCHAEEPQWQNGGYPAMSIANKASIHRTVCASEHLRRWMVDHGADESACEVVRCNVDTDFWDPACVDRERVRRDLGFSEMDVVVVMVARLDENKRPLVALDAIRAASAAKPVCAVFVGTGPLEGALNERLSTTTEVTVKLLSGGPLVVRDIYAAADLLILPSLAEGISLAVYEAMAMGLPVVVSDVGGHSELVVPETGRLVGLRGSDAADIKEFAAVLRELIQDADKRDALGTRARNRVLVGFTLSDMGQGLQRALSVETIRPRPSRRSAMAGWFRATGREYRRLGRSTLGAARRSIQVQTVTALPTAADPQRSELH